MPYAGSTPGPGGAFRPDRQEFPQALPVRCGIPHFPPITENDMKRLLLAFALLLASSLALAAVNINTATREELEALPGIGPVKAQAIVDYRNANGPFKSPEDVMKVKGIKEGEFGKLRGEISVSGRTTLPAGARKAEPATGGSTRAVTPAPAAAAGGSATAPTAKPATTAPAKEAAGSKASKAEPAKEAKATTKEEKAAKAKAEKDAKAKAKEEKAAKAKEEKAAKAKAEKEAKAAKTKESGAAKEKAAKEKAPKEAAGTEKASK